LQKFLEKLEPKNARFILANRNQASDLVVRSRKLSNFIELGEEEL
jgi:hypothetical protein